MKKTHARRTPEVDALASGMTAGEAAPTTPLGDPRPKSCITSSLWSSDKGVVSKDEIYSCATTSDASAAEPLPTLDEATADLSPWTRNCWSLYSRVALLTLVATAVGYDGSLMSSINAIDSFQKYYGLGERGASSTGILFAIIHVGQVVGALLAWVNDWLGRRRTIFIGCLGVCLSAVITATSPTFHGLVIARFFLAVFTTMATTATPMLLIELAPPRHRAAVSGMYNTLYYFGSIIAATTVYGTFNSPATHGSLIEWRLPLWLQLVCPGIVCLGMCFVPESPRWLVAQGRSSEARTVLARYHTADCDVHHPLVRLQMHEIETAMLASKPSTNLTSSLKTFFSPQETERALLSTKARRYRTFLAVAFAWIGQFSGNNVISYYLPILAHGVGVTSTSTQLLLNVLYAASGWIFAMCGANMHDRFGRRRMYLTALVGMAVSLAMTAGMAARYDQSLQSDRGASIAAIVFIFVFGVVFATGFTSMQPIYPAEVMMQDQRAQGMALYQMTSGTASFVNTFAAPVALAKFGWRVYVFFAFWDVAEWFTVYVWFVETSGQTLEGLREIFEAEKPRHESVRRRRLRKT